MRFALAAVVIAALPGAAAAQSLGGAVPHPGLPPISAPLPPIGLPLPQISYPLPSISLPPRDVAPLPSIDEQRRHRQRVILFPAFGLVYGYPGMMLAPAETTPPAASEKRREEPLFGTLLLYVQPEESVQVFVDGYYVGTPEDLNSGVEIETGPHTIELSAPGYESVKFNVKIDPSRPITYRGTLKPLAAKPPGDAAPAPTLPPSTLYYIPGCYLGNVDPKDVKLPANCDLSRLVTRKMR